MSFYLLHAGESLQKMTTGGALTNITLPSGTSLSGQRDRPARFAILSNQVIVVNAPSVNIVLDPTDLSMRVLTIDGPTTNLAAVSGGAGNLKGTYRYGYTFAILDGDTILTESPMSPLSDPTNFVNNSASLSSIDTSGTSGVNARIIYRTTSNGATFFEATRIANNSGTTTTDNTSDYDLALLASSEPKGNPPGHDGSDRFRIIVSWKDRLFASPLNDPDDVWISGNREIYSWSESRKFTVKTAGEDQWGVTAFMARRDELVIAKRRKLWKIIGDSPSNFEQILIADGIGCLTQNAAIVVRDTCYFMGEDGLYEYGNEGVKKLSRDKVEPWFTTDDYFDRAYFTDDGVDCPHLKYNQRYDKLELHLAPLGTDSIDRWVDYDIKQKAWFGPHRADNHTFLCAGTINDTNDMLIPVVGTAHGFLETQSPGVFSDTGQTILMDVVTKFHSGNTPDIEKYWGELAMLTKVEAAGDLTITPTIGGLDASAGVAITHDLTLGRERLPRLGTGRLCQLRFQNSENEQGVTIYGYEIPFHELGRR